MKEKLFIPLNATKSTGTSSTSPTERPNKSIELGKWIKRFFGISSNGDPNLVLNQQGNWVITAYDWVIANGTNLLNHLSNTSNPHSVTASQVGLGNVNNTSDANKPISTATQTALDLKANNATQRSGSVIAFDTDANYGTIASPLTGNITGDYTDVIIGVVQMLIHNDSVAPTIPATWIKANTSASYTIGVVNFIAITWLSSNIATYTIWKSA